MRDAETERERERATPGVAEEQDNSAAFQTALARVGAPTLHLLRIRTRQVAAACAHVYPLVVPCRREINTYMYCNMNMYPMFVLRTSIPEMISS